MSNFEKRVNSLADKKIKMRNQRKGNKKKKVEEFKKISVNFFSISVIGEILVSQGKHSTRFPVQFQETTLRRMFSSVLKYQSDLIVKSYIIDPKRYSTSKETQPFRRVEVIIKYNRGELNPVNMLVFDKIKVLTDMMKDTFLRVEMSSKVNFSDGKKDDWRRTSLQVLRDVRRKR